MGNSLYSFLANLFMSFFEAKLNNDSKFLRVWIRYVDDVFAIINASQFNNLLNFLNIQYTTIKFTVEKEVVRKLPFLDILVVKNNGNFEFDIFRKPTNTPSFICKESPHCEKQKYSALYDMIHRMYTLPLTRERFEKEVNFGINEIQPLKH